MDVYRGRPVARPNRLNYAGALRGARSAYSIGRNLFRVGKRVVSSYNSNRTSRAVNKPKSYRRGRSYKRPLSRARPGYLRKSKFCKKVEKCLNDGTPEGKYVNPMVKTSCEPVVLTFDSLAPNETQEHGTYDYLQPSDIALRLSLLWPTISATAIQREQVHIRKWSQTRTWSNFGQLPMTVTFYEFTPSSTSTVPLLTRYQTAISNVSSGASIRDEGIVPAYAMHELRQYFTLKKTTKKILGPGMSHSITHTKSNFQFDFNDIDATSSPYFRNFGVVVMVCIEGSLQNTGAACVKYPDGKIDCRGFETFVARCPNSVPDSDSIETMITGLNTTNNYAVGNFPPVTAWSKKNPADILQNQAAAVPSSG